MTDKPDVPIIEVGPERRSRLAYTRQEADARVAAVKRALQVADEHLDKAEALLTRVSKALVEFHDHKAYQAYGCGTWAEFADKVDLSRSRSYQLIAHGRLVNAIEQQMSTHVDSLSEYTARLIQHDGPAVVAAAKALVEAGEEAGKAIELAVLKVQGSRREARRAERIATREKKAADDARAARIAEQGQRHLDQVNARAQAERLAVAAKPEYLARREPTTPFEGEVTKTVLSASVTTSAGSPVAEVQQRLPPNLDELRKLTRRLKAEAPEDFELYRLWFFGLLTEP